LAGARRTGEAARRERSPTIAREERIELEILSNEERSGVVLWRG
jgi:hypothetical protein